MKWFLDSCNYDCPGSTVLSPTDSSTASCPMLNKQQFLNYYANSPNHQTAEEVKLEHFHEKLAIEANSEEEQREDFLEFAFNAEPEERLNVFNPRKKSIQKEPHKPNNEYRKNICAYITKKVIREFISEGYRQHVTNLCLQQGCEYEQVRAYFLARVEKITGLRHLSSILSDFTSDADFKAVFSKFFEWFMKERYVRSLLAEGRMSDRKAYIEYKNKVLSQFFKQDCCAIAGSMLPLQT